MCCIYNRKGQLSIMSITIKSLPRKKKEIATCDVCMDNMNISNRMPVECACCDFIACRCCYKRYIKESNEYAKCMNCKKEWDYELVCQKFERSFVDKLYKNVRENVLYDKEMALMADTQPHVERKIVEENLQKLLKEITIEREEREVIFRAKVAEIHRQGSLRISDFRRAFVHKCSHENCKGFLSSSWKCNLCMNWSCNKCHDVIGKTKDNHICNPDLVATKLLLESDTKSCPTCHMGITKIDGCNMMFCVECHTAFDWKTGIISTGVIHNPHYFEWRSKGGVVDRDIGDIRCGRGLDHHDTREFFRRTRKEISPVLYESVTNHIQRVVHIREVEIPLYNTNYINDNMDLRIRFMRNLITEVTFKNLLQIREKQVEKKKRFHNVLSMFVDCATEIFYRMFDNENVVIKGIQIQKHIQELHCLREYSNECISKIANTYKIKRRRYIDDKFKYI